ncbi:50S ribosomal protein L24e [Candidatus Woesearchaeota archaeon]|nr:50S ribosomal protein L24e [Candidatus Woesearchaeota archaeon]
MKCSFCGTSVPSGKGKLFVRKSGKVLYFCSSKCEKHELKLGRKARDVKWTKEARKARGAK